MNIAHPSPTPPISLNPIEKQVSIMNTAWSTFRKDTRKRILVWQVHEDACSMIDAFVEMQKHPTHLSTDDTFVLIKTPYQHALQYSHVLKKELCKQFDIFRENLSTGESGSDWSYQPNDTPDNPAGFIKNMLSYGSKYHQAIGHLAPVLIPSSINTGNAYSDWIMEILKLELPERFRVVLVETIEHPYLQHFLSSKDSRILVQRLDVNMGLLAQQTFAQEKTTSPAGIFRRLLMDVVVLVETGSTHQVKSKATEALNFAHQQQWKDQEVVIRMLFAGSLMKENHFTEAIQVYQIARKTAEQTAQEKHPGGQKLVMLSWFAQAGAELADGDNRSAASSYDQAAIAASKDNNPALTLEAFRMAGFTLSRKGDSEAALQRGQCAVDIANTLSPDQCGMTTIGSCIVDMMRIIDNQSVQDIQLIKSFYKLRQQQIHQYTEERGVELTQQGKPNALSIVEQEQQNYQTKALEEATRPMHSLVSSASPSFQKWEQDGSRLLGKNWLLTNDIALPLSSITTIETNKSMIGKEGESS